MGDNFQLPSPAPAQAQEPQQNPTPQNATLLQAFEWYTPPDHAHFLRLSSQIPQLSQHGISSLWIPPSCRATSPQSNGYDIYDLYDLGEFDQKGSVATKWGTKAQLLELARKGKEYGVGLYWDAVLNHRFGADHRERCKAVEVDANDRRVRVSGEYEIDAWVGFDFPGRGDQESTMKYHWYHFSGVDFNADDPGKAGTIYQILGEQSQGWAKSPEDVDGEKGNYDYLMGCDVDYSHPEVVDDVLNWGRWLAKEVSIKGIRFDAVKHFSESFLKKFVKMLDGEFGEGWFLVGEFWKDSLQSMTDYLDRMDHKFSLFDAPLVYNFGEISTSVSADLRKVFDDTLVQKAPVCAVTLVQNHDTQPLQALHVPITPWFLPLGYALILIREAGYPCIFYGDLYGLCTPTSDNPSPTRPTSGPVTIIPKLLLARKLYAYGPQTDYFDYPTCIGWVRHGTWDKKDKCAVVMSNAGEGWKWMFVGVECAGQQWTDVLEWRKEVVTIGENGWAEFRCGGCSVSVWVWEGAKGRDEFETQFDFDIYAASTAK
ncbi:glycoside hydrolase family 13 protein [Neurospora crassa]|uniref:Glucan 1,4-alpha-maltohexaosidase n=1 Tax=Neurospora crassa (strain ATCC 24698 / 74-OR23-1A / CBS 708.71 / DSM 1257 / FGSC 987) TaxID=367110 RepID=Q7SBZ7_NEUCR|nr:glucan 1,4-alpha-maltohexaosidase [Neurospora crassa OR74A]EAA33974.3 glucan 1,4-alpha-maltohexaosidase [Neurospora crassa OR74A]KHE83339.1 glycoside hydrolase family 13 protein [Neurospora crassa]|eukprot:XP_963210.3 glucan 1,4-alpha-maltohexaosidase [Neurospora crassa OR74A]